MRPIYIGQEQAASAGQRPLYFQRLSRPTYLLEYLPIASTSLPIPQPTYSVILSLLTVLVFFPLPPPPGGGPSTHPLDPQTQI